MEILRIDVESIALKTFDKKGGGTFQMQEFFVHEVDFDGNPPRYPKSVFGFPPKRDGVVTPYKPGQYTPGARSFKVVNNRLELGFLNLIPLAQSQKV